MQPISTTPNQRRYSKAAPAALALTLIALAVSSAYAAAPAPADADSSTATVDSAEAAATTGPIETITVAGQRRTAETVSRAKQERAFNIINTTSQEEIRKLPDINGGEAAARLPGVSLYVGSGRGRYIYIRGLDSDLTGTTYAGIHLPPTNPVTPQGGGRAFAFDSFPAGMIGAMTVTKTNVPAQDAEALGGTVDIAPKAIPADKDHFLDFRLGTGRRNSRGTGLADVAVTGGVRFGGDRSADGDKTRLPGYGDKPFSFVGSLAYYQDQSGTDNYSASFANKKGVPNNALSNFTQAYYRFYNVTMGGGAELAYQPDADTRLYARYLHSGYREIVNRQKLAFKLSGTPSQNADGSLTSTTTFDKSSRSMDERVTLDIFQLGGENRLGPAKVDYNVAFTQGKDYRPHDTSSTFSYKPTGATLTYNNQANVSYPTYSVAGANQLDASQYKLSQLTNNTQTYLTKEWSGAGNATLPGHLFASATDEEMKFGLAARYRTTTHSITPFNSSAVPSVNMSTVLDGAPVTYYGGRYQNGASISTDAIAALYGAGTGFTGSATDAISGQASASRSTENVFAAYGQDQMTFGALSFIGGLRVEATRANYGGYVANAALTSVNPTQHQKNYANLFPSLQARYEMAPRLVGRASYSRTIARPGFNQASPSATIDPALFTVSQGNPDLKPTVSDNFDLSIEHYLNQGGIVSLGLFDKELKNYIVANTSTVNFAASDPLYGALAGTPSQVVSYKNLASAHARGLEFNYDQHYKMLPGWFGNLGSSFNYTFVNSKGQIRPGESSALPSTARNTYNAQVYWEGDVVSARLAANYIGRSLLVIGKSAATDQFSEGHLSLDFGGSYNLNKHLQAYVAARNLLDTPNTQTEGTSNRVIQREVYGKTLMAGVTGHF